METGNSEELELVDENQRDIRRDNGVFLCMAFFFGVICLDLFLGLHAYIEYLAIPDWTYAGLSTLCFLGATHGAKTLNENKLQPDC